MIADFPRILTLLRKEKGISQKQAACDLGISQALLSHYEKGIRECGLDFLVRTAEYYSVSCDYLLGRSPDKTGTTLTVDDIPEPDAGGRDNTFRGSVLPVLNKKLISNSLNILFDILQKVGNKGLIHEISSFIMLAVYRAFRVVYLINPKNQAGFFTVPQQLCDNYADAAMLVSVSNAKALAQGEAVAGHEPVTNRESAAITTDILSKQYPLFSSSLFNLIQNSENRISGGR